MIELILHIIPALVIQAVVVEARSRLAKGRYAVDRKLKEVLLTVLQSAVVLVAARPLNLNRDFPVVDAALVYGAPVLLGLLTFVVLARSRSAV